MKIIVSDFDGTLYSENYKENVRVINEFVKKGNMFIIATGRAMNYLSEDLQMADIDCEYYICNDGAVIFDRYFNVVFRKDIKQSIVRPIFQELADNDNNIEVLVDTSHGYVSDMNVCANGIIARPYDRDKAFSDLESILRKYPDVNGYISTNWINIFDNSVSKKKAIDYLCSTYHLDRENIYTVGDGLNDYEMIEAFKGYTFSNCSEDLKKISSGTVSSIPELISLIDVDEEEEDDFFEEF